MAPEYAIQGKLSEKVDVYSYGVVVLEIISGRKSSEIRLELITEYLIKWVNISKVFQVFAMLLLLSADAFVMPL